jgi:hypothetical protein
VELDQEGAVTLDQPAATVDPVGERSTRFLAPAARAVRHFRRRGRSGAGILLLGCHDANADPDVE